MSISPHTDFTSLQVPLSVFASVLNKLLCSWRPRISTVVPGFRRKLNIFQTEMQLNLHLMQTNFVTLWDTPMFCQARNGATFCWSAWLGKSLVLGIFNTHTHIYAVQGLTWTQWWMHLHASSESMKWMTFKGRQTSVKEFQTTWLIWITN